VGLADLLFIGLAIFVTRESLAAHREAAEVNARNLARLLDTGLAASFDRIDLALQAVREERGRLARGGAMDGAALEAFMAREKDRTPDLLALRIADAEGIVRYNAPPVAERVTVVDREYYLGLREKPAVEPLVSHGYVGRITRVPVLSIARRLTGPDERFEGVVFGTVELGHLEELLSAVRVGPHGVLALRHQDHGLIAFKGAGADPPIGDRRVSDQLAALVAEGRPDAVYQGRGGLDGERTVAFQRFTRYPLYVVVALSPDDYLAEWRRQTAVVWILVTGFAALTVAGAVYGTRAWRRRLVYDRLLEESTENMRESEERFRTAFLTSPDSVTLNRLQDGTYVAVNEGFTRALGWSEAEVLGRSSLELGVWVDPADRARLVAGLERDGFVENQEVRFRRKDGSTLAGLISARIITLQGQRHLLSIARDVATWKEAEAERDRLQVQFQQAQRLDGLGRLAGGVAHDFNNLLTVILGCAECLRERFGEDPDEDLEQILAAAGRARDLTRQLLAFARKQVIAPVSLDLGAVVRGTEPLLRRVLGEDVTVTVELAEPLWPVLCDPAQLERVLLNLALNARDAMPDGGALVITAGNAEHDAAAEGEGRRPGQWVRLAVRDAGAGMTPEVQAHLFEPFFTTKARGKGTGLGLATVHGIVAQLGGYIDVESAPGQGTTIALSLPRAAEQPAPPRPPAPMRPAQTACETILVVEDEPLVRNVTVRVLEGAGYQVLVAESGEDAVGVVERHAGRLDLVVSDVIMPGLSGPHMMEQLRRGRPGLRALYVSGYPQDAIAHRGVDLEVEFLPKPFTAASLLERVRALVGAPAA
jgi:PAS domain S-box-containing protein